MRLKYCPGCKENSVRSKVYTNDQQERVSIDFCINRGCGYQFVVTRKPDGFAGIIKPSRVLV